MMVMLPESNNTTPISENILQLGQKLHGYEWMNEWTNKVMNKCLFLQCGLHIWGCLNYRGSP